MASRSVVRGLLRIGQQASQATGYSATRQIQVMSVDDSAVAFAQSHTALNTGGAVANEFDKVFDSTPSTSTDATSATITHITTFGTSEANFTIRRIALHDDAAATVSASSTTLVAGIDAQALTKTTDFTLAITVRLKYTEG
jgi:hypothetical protein